VITVTIYTRKNEPNCENAELILAEVKEQIPFQLIKVDVDSDATLQSVFGKLVPLIKAGPYSIRGEVTREQLIMTLGAARDRQEHIEQIGDNRYLERYKRARNFSFMDSVTEWLSSHYLFLFNAILFFYSGLPFIAPVLMKNGFTAPARVIYAIYSPFCHQMAFRSWFLFGEQTYYPRDVAGINSVASYESAILQNQNVDETSLDFISTARSFLGNDQVGYKIALCERDIALYGGLLIFGIIFAMTGRKIKQIPWYIWLGIGLLPIGIDGASQLPSLISGLPGWLPIRESTPFWRTLTGGLFGVFSAWYLYPLIEETMKDTRALILSKKEVISQTRTG
jgi:uncharacterized membrane protein